MFRIEAVNRYNMEEKIDNINDIKDIKQILIQLVDDERTENEAVNWASNATFGDRFVNQKYKFIIECYREGNTGTKKNVSVPNKDIVDTIKKYKETRKEFHATIYSDDIWKVDIELHPYGVIRFWASREDKRGNYNNTLVTVYEYNGKLEYSADFKLKELVIRKILSTYKSLLAANLITN
jgi:hypothetical protein